ncbi:MAG: hypothetical protein DRP84_06635 [Spirochaetes bacterium]|nr:MAG: hypothetical protein DRP84_06635 [Spirochaetota bacterium]
MCLSTVYLEERKEEAVIVKEAAKIICKGNKIEIHTLFGENRVAEDFAIQEIDLIKNYVVLQKTSPQVKD